MTPPLLPSLPRPPLCGVSILQLKPSRQDTSCLVSGRGNTCRVPYPIQRQSRGSPPPPPAPSLPIIAKLKERFLSGGDRRRRGRRQAIQQRQLHVKLALCRLPVMKSQALIHTVILQREPKKHPPRRLSWCAPPSIGHCYFITGGSDGGLYSTYSRRVHLSA